MAMDMREITRLLLKLAGLYLIVTVLIAAPTVIRTPEPYRIDGAASLVLYALVGFALFFLPGFISNRIVRVPTETGGAVSSEKLVQVGTILLGVYFTASAAYDLVYTYVKTHWFPQLHFPGSRGPDMPPDDFAYLIASSAQIVIGLALWLGSKYVVRAAFLSKNDR